MSINGKNTTNLNKIGSITSDQNNSNSNDNVTNFNKKPYTQGVSENTEFNLKKITVAEKKIKSTNYIANHMPASKKKSGNKEDNITLADTQIGKELAIETDYEATISESTKNKEGSKSGFQLLCDFISRAWQKCKNLFSGISEIDLVITIKENSTITKKIAKAISKMGQEELQQKIEQELDKEVESLETKPDRLKRKLEILTELIDIIIDMNYSQDKQGIDNINDILYGNLARTFFVKDPENEEINNFYTSLKNIFDKYIRDQISDIDFSVELPFSEVVTYKYSGDTVDQLKIVETNHTEDSLEQIMIEFGRDIPRGCDKFKIKVDGEIIFDSVTDKKFNKEMRLILMAETSTQQANIGFKIVENIILPKILEAVDASKTKLDKNGKDQLVKDLLTQMYQAGLADTLKVRDSAIERKKKGQIAKGYSLQFSPHSDHNTTEISVETDNDRITIDNYFNAELNLCDLSSFSTVAKTEKLNSSDTRLICKTDGTKPYFEYLKISHASNIRVIPIVEELSNLYKSKDLTNYSQDCSELVAKLEQILATKSDMPDRDDDNVFVPTEMYSLKIQLINRLTGSEKNNSENTKKNMTILKNKIEDFLVFLEEQKQALATVDQKKIIDEIIEILKSEYALIAEQISEDNSDVLT